MPMLPSIAPSGRDDRSLKGFACLGLVKMNDHSVDSKRTKRGGREWATEEKWNAYSCSLSYFPELIIVN